MTTWCFPVSAPHLTSGFGARKNPVTGELGQFHPAVDFGAPAGTPVFAAEAGKVLKMVLVTDGVPGKVLTSNSDGSGGSYVNLLHAGPPSLMTRYLHLSRVDVVEGQAVAKGQQLGLVGSTGWTRKVLGPDNVVYKPASTGAHLHFEVWQAGKVVDPLLYLPPLPHA